MPLRSSTTYTTKQNFMKKQNEKDLESFKKEVYNYLRKQLEISEEVAKSQMKYYDDILDVYWKDKLSVAATATGMMHNF